MASGNPNLPEGTDSIIDSDGFEAVDREGGAPLGVADVSDEDEETEPAPTTTNQTEDIASPGTASTDTGGSTGTSGASFFSGKFEELQGQATDRVFAFAQAGKDRATGAIDDIIRMVEDAASEIDDKVGSQYGDYARRAVAGLTDFSEAFKGKEVDELFGNARDLITKSPGIALSAATAVGFVLARLAKSGVAEARAAAADTKTAD